MPRAVLERKNKAEFSIMFRERLDHMEEVLTETIPRKRASWIDPVGLANLFRFYLDNPQISWPWWILWNIYGCDETLDISEFRK